MNKYTFAVTYKDVLQVEAETEEQAWVQLNGFSIEEAELLTIEEEKTESKILQFKPRPSVR